MGSLSKTIKTQLESISLRVVDLEKRAEHQIRQILQKTDRTRREQMKRVNELLKEAQKFKSSGVVRQATKLQKDLEKAAGQRVQVLMKKLHLPSQQEIEKLQDRINQLEVRLKSAETRSKRARSTRSKSSTSS